MGGMRHFAVPLSIVATLAIAVTLFHLKQRVGDLEKDLSQVNRAIADHRETIQILRSEWSFLNRPQRVEALAEKFLAMGQTPPERLIRLEDLPLRAPSEGVLPAAATPAGGLAPQIGSLQ